MKTRKEKLYRNPVDVTLAQLVTGEKSCRAKIPARFGNRTFKPGEKWIGRDGSSDILREVIFTASKVL
jgi:hypothetical protein